MTGIMDCKLTNGSTGEEALGRLLETLRDVAILTNKAWAQEARS
jgi:hypothetical protein